MANDYNVIRGLTPKNGDAKHERNVIDSGNTEDLFIGSAVYKVAGEVRSALTGNGDLIRGAIVALFDSTGMSVNSLAASTVGYCENTYEEDEEYIITHDGTEYAGVADNGKMYNLTAESRTDSTDRFLSRGRSGRQLDSSTENADTRQFVVLGMTEAPGNTAATATCEVYGRINPVNWQNA